MKKLIAFLLLFALLVSFKVNASAAEGTSAQASVTVNIKAKSALLIEAETGTILYEKNKDERLAPASVTKIMTLLLVVEAIEDDRIKITDEVVISKHAASMGGSQVFLEEGERMTVEELLKCTVIASANDAAVALAELIYGSEGAFVDIMNKRAIELGLQNTNFENATGLDDDTKAHYTSAYDIATMSRYLIRYDLITKYASLWQDTIRNGEFTLTNTNRLVRYYDGCNGLKTGSTDKAGYCISAAAKRDGMQLIAVIMGAETRDERNEAARALLDYGFSNYSIYSEDEKIVEEIRVTKGKVDKLIAYSTKFETVIEKGKIKKINLVYDIPEYLSAPVVENEVIGKIIYEIDGVKIGESDIFVKCGSDKLSYFDIFIRLIKNIFS